MDITIVRAVPEDAETLVPIQILAFHNDARIYPDVAEDGPPGYDSVAHMTQRIAEDVTYKIVADGQCVGGIILFQEGEGHWHLDVLFVHPDYHRRGIGKQALQFIEKAHPATRWTLHTPLYATYNHRFYEQAGYVNVGEEMFGDFPVIAYEKKMSHSG